MCNRRVIVEKPLAPAQSTVKEAEAHNRVKRSRRGKIGERRQINVTHTLSEQEIIHKVLNGYDWRVRPRGLNTSIPDTGGPVIVNVNIMMRSISKIDDVNMEYSVQFTFREQWVDSRLAYKSMGAAGAEMPKFVVLTPNDQSQQVWMPDTFFQNEKEARRHMIDKPNVMIRIYPDGEMLYSVRLSMVLSCPMSLEYYPLDRQTCLIDLASYAYTTEDIEYKWKAEGPVQLKDGMKNSLPSFELQDVITGLCTSKTNTGEYSCLRTILTLKREYSYYLITLYIPSFMLVVVSWVNFWIDKDAVPARVSLGVTTLLTMTTQASGVNAKLPPVSYTKAIDVWIGICLAFIFGALLEFALVNYAGRVEFLEKERKKQKVSLLSDNRWIPAMTLPLMMQQRSSVAMNVPPPNMGRPSLQPPHATPPQHHGIENYPIEAICPECKAEQTEQKKRSYSGFEKPLLGNFSEYTTTSGKMPGVLKAVQKRSWLTWLRLWLVKYKERSKRIDVISRLVFPIGFFFFNCVYWTAYLV
ncbi:Neur chan memb and Neur chan LBD domain containin g protein [Trichuris trichiura]|uniref:Neur chan memb and Neur chan LBD domain containin g protein n=1 Tax=Trichuris trichiura TaxID=36087 RepID=A0A077ZCW7_TRITR|nr:Neur chan memb and Neur chan LBD domain containin g protein [Trichuris trichiura]